jgi:ketosteroid isomerase-like protein
LVKFDSTQIQPMHPNQKLLETFYTAFQQRDYLTMQSCYSENAVFSDPVFPNLNATEVRAMWQMFCVKSKDMQITFSDVIANDSKGSANWQAHYTFGATGNKVTNNISAQFVFENGKIVRHTDSFNFYQWARQALGFYRAFIWVDTLGKKQGKNDGNPFT